MRGFKQRQSFLPRFGFVFRGNPVFKLNADDKSPFVTSGIRFGTAAITTRGLKEADMDVIVGLIDRIITNPDNEQNTEAVAQNVHQLMEGRPLFNP